MAISTLKKVVYMVMLCMVVRTMTKPHALVEAVAVTCVGVSKSLAPCMPYLKGPGGVAPPAKCCGGVKALKSMARTQVDRRTACNCMKKAASGITGLNYGNAARLPTQCGVRIAYSFSANTNCNTVQ